MDRRWHVALSWKNKQKYELLSPFTRLPRQCLPSGMADDL